MGVSVYKAVHRLENTNCKGQEHRKDGREA